MQSLRKYFALRYEQEIDTRRCAWHPRVLRPRIYAGVDVELLAGLGVSCHCDWGIPSLYDLSRHIRSGTPGRVNSYAAANVRVEEGQKVVDTGVYAWVRHPMYFGTLFLIIGTPLALGSWYALALTPVLLGVLYFRIRSEEQVLVRDLVGYIEYQNKVKYRLIPFVW
jgi:hypothetical protein